MNTRKSFWATSLDQARTNPTQWTPLGRTYKEASAKQIASDIRNAHKRPNGRIRGLHTGEQWEATAAPNENGNWTITIRPVSTVNA